MAFRVRISYGTAGTDTLTVNPVYQPAFSYAYGENTEPPTIAYMDESWTFDGRIKGSDAAGTWDTLKDKLTDTSDPPIKLEVQRDTGGGFSTFHELSTTTHERFRVETIDNPNTGQQGEWASHVKFTLRAIARRKVASSLVIRAELSFAYDDAGLATRNWRGTVQTVSGTSAQSAARSLGTLALPGGTWAQSSYGPEGLNVKVLDGDRDTEAEWEAIAQEYGESAPGSVGSFGHIEETIVSQDPGGSGLTTTTRITGEAAGSGALSYVNSLEPSGWLSKRVVNDVARRRASVEFVVEDAGEGGSRGDEAKVKRSFTVQGSDVGGISLFPVAGPFDPIIQRGGRAGYTVTENIEIRASDVSGLDDVAPPDPLVYLDGFEDGPVRSDNPIELEARGSDATQDRYVRKLTRVYKLSTPAGGGGAEALLREIAIAVLQLSVRGSGGGSGGGLTLGFAGGVGAAGSIGGGLAGTLPGGFAKVKVKVGNVL